MKYSEAVAEATTLAKANAEPFYVVESAPRVFDTDHMNPTSSVSVVHPDGTVIPLSRYAFFLKDNRL